jgi:hypothetical protein
MVMHKVGPKKAAAVEGLDPRILTAFEVLGWAEDARATYLAENAALGQAGMVKGLNRLIDEQNAA